MTYLAYCDIEMRIGYYYYYYYYYYIHSSVTG